MSNLNFQPLEPSKQEQEWMQWQREFWQQMLQAFALTSEQIGSLRDTNHCHGQAQETVYRDLLNSSAKNWVKKRLKP